MKCILLSLFLLLSSVGFSQSASTTCVDHDKPCPEWLHKLIGQYPPLPDAPLPQRTVPATFWTFRTFNEPVLRTNKQCLTSKTFLILHGAMFGAMIAAHSSKETYASELPALGAVTGLDYVMDRFITRSFSVEAPIYAIVHYVRAAK